MNNIIPTPGAFKADEKIRFWAKLIRICSLVLIWLSVAAAFILLCCSLFLLSLFVLVGGVATCIGGMISSALMWGFADVVEGVKKTANDVAEPAPAEEELPEL